MWSEKNLFFLLGTWTEMAVLFCFVLFFSLSSTWVRRYFSNGIRIMYLDSLCESVLFPLCRPLIVQRLFIPLSSAV